jgi:O-antigen ligase
LAFVTLAVGLLTMQSEHWRANRAVLSLAVAVLAVPLLQLLPLPSGLWAALPGRSIIAEIDRTTGLGEVWRPLSMTPYETRNALLSLGVPCSVIVLGSQLSSRRLRQVLFVVLGLGALSAVLGLLQTLSSPTSGLYLYKLTNNGSAVGLFANRNHQAFLLAAMIPLLVYAAASSAGARRFRWLLSSLGGLLLLPLILITGSRSGMILALFAILAVPFLVFVANARRAERSPRDRREMQPSRWPRLLLVGSAIGLVTLTVTLGRALAWERLGEASPYEDMRFRILPTLWELLGQHIWVGTGLGSFERIYQIHEPDGLLAAFYMNHAHNDWLELALTGGLPAMLLLAVAVALAVRRALAVWKHGDQVAADPAMARTGLVFLLLTGFASLSDYPLRTPACAALFALAVMWAAIPSQRTGLVQDGLSG